MSNHQNRSKISRVLRALEIPEIRSWYEAEYGLDITTLTHESVRTYGTGHHGDLADLILADAGENE
jgi:hypothetical protein